jgi:predicted  nucleic acid-binding Zn-ribbon protein
MDGEKASKMPRLRIHDQPVGYLREDKDEDQALLAEARAELALAHDRLVAYQLQVRQLEQENKQLQQELQDLQEDLEDLVKHGEGSPIAAVAH